jgi:hypothetical protein
MRIWSLIAMVVGMSFLGGCAAPGRYFEQDFSLLEQAKGAVLLRDGDALVAVVPAYQGRVMTSTFGGLGGPSLGWVNQDLIASGETKPHMNAFGGEDRFWLGPEGGQFGIFFEAGAPFELASWQTPPLIDTEPYPVTRKTSTSVSFRKEATITNFSGTRFDLGIDRTVRLKSRDEVEYFLEMDLDPGVRMVAYESENTLWNLGDEPWTREGGMLSIWILGMYKASPTTTVVVPYRPGPVEDLGPIVNDAYFGKVPTDRLVVGEQAIFFKGDGGHRSKIGVGPLRARPYLGSWDAGGKVLTIVWYNLQEDAVDYVNSMWEIQEEPFAGDVVNSYNDGPPEPGAEGLGAFYELETSSPAASLEPGQSIIHFHRTLHLTGPRGALDAVARRTLGVGLDEIEGVFGEPR